jgi:Subtilase family/CARDB
MRPVARLGGWKGYGSLAAAALVAAAVVVMVASWPLGSSSSSSSVTPNAVRPAKAGPPAAPTQGVGKAPAREKTSAFEKASDESDESAAQALPISKAVPDRNREGHARIRLLAGAFDPLSDPLPASRGIPLRSELELAPDRPQYWLVQVRDRRFQHALRAVRSAGGAVAGVIPSDTYMVRATPKQRFEIARSPAVRWIGYYQPAWRVPVAARGKKGLLDLAGKRTYRVSLFRDDPKLRATTLALAAKPGVKIVEDAGAVVDVSATSAQVPAIAALPAVQWIGIRPKVVAHNVNARWVNDTGVRDVYAATAPGRLTGAGQTAAVADTGLNYTYDLNGRAHIGFRDCNPDGTGCREAVYTQVTPGNAAASINNVQNNASGHRKMVAYFDLGSTGPNMYDESSHGSHTAGSVDGDQPPYDQYTGSDGLAPAANHVHQNIATASGGLGGLPADDYDLWRQAYRPRNPASVLETSTANGNPGDYVSPGYVPLEDARTHNNSYGLLAPVIDEGSAARLDRFVWDHEDMTIVVSAGNAGPDPASIGSPSVAKNELSSGASANGRQPMVSIDSMAAFSSHGPTGDGRFGVDLATPGQIVVSAKGGTTDGYHVAQGTSMSGPILTGLATLVRQYFFDGYAQSGGDGFAAGTPHASRQHNPSAALVKATLINGAVRMRGRYTGTDGNNPLLDGEWPSGGQGFGRVDLNNSLYFANDPSNNWYADVYRGDTTGNPNFRSFPVSALPAARTFEIRVDPGQPLDVTLSWTDTPAAPPAGTPTLINNLDLVVTGPGGATYIGNNMNSRGLAGAGVNVAETLNSPAGPADTRNLSERIRVANPAAGTYTITVNAPLIALGNQGFALAASGNISPVGGPQFVPGPALQRDAAGTPTISNVRVDTISANTAKIFFDTNEPTTATAEVSIGGIQTTFVDSYNVGTATGFPGLDEAPASIETSAEYGDRPVVGTKHEILVTGLDPGQAVTATLRAKDLAATPNESTQVTNFASPSSVFQADADDTGQLYEDPATAAQVGQWRTGTQLYASDGGGGTGILGAFAFRIPQAAVNPADIVGAAVELTSTHDWVNRYTEDPVFDVDLLNPSVEAGWGTQSYSVIKGAAADARVFPETTHKRGDYTKYAFTFRCADLEALKNTLATDSAGERMAAFRWETQPAHVGLFAMDFGFNRRSRGPTERPRLLLFTADQTAYPDGQPCDPGTPAPTISQVGLHEGHSPGSFTVSWETNVSADSLVLFREQGSTPWTQVGTPVLTKLHQVEVFGIDPSKDYEFAVRSAACNGATTTDANGGSGYSFFKPESLGPGTVHASYDFEGSDDGWTTMTVDRQDPDQPSETEWTRGSPGAAGSGEAFKAKPYFDQNDAFLTAPGAVSFTGTLAAIEFYENHNLEQPPPDPFTTSDALHVQYSTNGGSSWTSAEIYQGTSPGYPNFVFRRATFPAPGGPVLIRFNLTSDDNTSFPLFDGASVDEVSFVSYAPTGGRPSVPATGPVPPPSAGATGLNPPATRTGAATPEDITAGTGYCDIPSGTATGPDLVVSNMTATQNTGTGGQNKQPRAGDKLTISAVVKNEGSEAAPATKTEFLLDGTTVLGLVDTPPLAAGQQTTVSTTLDTRGMSGEHSVRASADKLNAAGETEEGNNVGVLTFSVKGNKVSNPSFEQSDSSGSAPASWSGSSTEAGTTSWSDGGSDGQKSASITGTGGSAMLDGVPPWTSDPIAVTAGEVLDLVVSVKANGLSSAPSAGLLYLGAAGQLLETVKVLSAPLTTVGFQTLEQTVTIPAGAASVRVVLTGFAPADVATAGTVTFDDVGLFAH